MGLHRRDSGTREQRKQKGHFCFDVSMAGDQIIAPPVEYNTVQ